MKPSLRSERGIALVLSLFLMMAMSVIAASLMFMSQTETYSSMNYRLMSQARYGAESGLQKAANFLMYPASYTAPTPGGADDLNVYTFNGVSPVTWNNKAVVLSANPNVPSNYPIAAIQTAFQNAVSGTVPMGATSVAYQPYAKLMSMQQIQVYGGGQATIQTWLVVADGSVTTGRTAKVEVTATVETPIVPATLYAAFATNPGCGALTFGGSATTDSYSSSAPLVGGSPALGNSGGNVGTNGNLGDSGHATINGNVSTPRVGVGNCSAGNVNAVTSSGNATINGNVLQLPQAQVMPAPPAPNPMPPNAASDVSTCVGLGITSPATCVSLLGNTTINPHGSTVVLGNISMNGGTLTLATGNYMVNSISLGGNATVSIAPSTGAVIMNVAGVGQATPIDFTGGSFSNGSFNPALFQIDYAGTGQVILTGNTNAAAMVYAPNAAGTLLGNDDFYGSIVTSTLNVSGNAKIHYDTRLSSEFFLVGNTMMSGFSWKRF
jgi:hypothetical protein